MHEDPLAPTDAVLAATEEALTASYRTVFDALDEAFCVIEMVLDAAGTAVDYRFVEVNRAFEEHTGVGEVVGRTVREVVPQIEPVWIETYGAVARTGEPARFVEEVRVLRRWFQVYAWPFGRPERRRVAVHFTDISERKLAEDAFVHRERRYRSLFESIDAGFCVLDVLFGDHEWPIDFRCAEANPAFARHFGSEDPRGRTIAELVPDLEPVWFDAFGNVALTGEPTRFVAYTEALGRWFDVYAFRIEERNERRVAALFSDVTERKRAELGLQENVAVLRHLAHHDALTGLPNRLLFEEKLREAVASANRHGRPFAVSFLSLDGFEVLSDGANQASGDAVLIEVARRLRRALRASDMLARLHGDEFVFILPEMSEPHEAGSLAQKLVALVRGPMDVDGTTVHVRASVGVGFYPNDGADPRAVLRAADDAMHRAKLGGTNAVGYVVAPPSEEARSGGPS